MLKYLHDVDNTAFTDHIFYMKTRGFTEAQAKSILVYGFCQEVIDLIDISSMHEAMKSVVKSLKIN